MSKHSTDRMVFESAIIFANPTGVNGPVRIYLPRAGATYDYYANLSPVRHRMHSLKECPDPYMCWQIPADKFKNMPTIEAYGLRSRPRHHIPM